MGVGPSRVLAMSRPELTDDSFSIEHIAKFKKKQSELMKTARKETAATAKRVVQPLSGKDHGGDHDQSCSWKREILEGRRPRQEGKKGESEEDSNRTTEKEHAQARARGEDETKNSDLTGEPANQTEA